MIRHDKKFFLILFCAIFLYLLLSFTVARADVIAPLDVEYCAKFINVNNFDEYIFLKINLNKWRIKELYEIIEQDSCLATEGNSNEYSFFAIKKSNFSKEKFDFIPKSYYAYLTNLSTKQQDYLKSLLGREWTQDRLKRKAIVATYLKENQNFIPLDVNLNIVHSVDIFHIPIPRKIEEIFKIQQSNNGFEVVNKQTKTSKTLGIPSVIDDNNLQYYIDSFVTYLIMLLFSIFIEFLVFSILDKKTKIANLLKLSLINLITISLIVLIFSMFFNFYLTELFIIFIEFLLIKYFFHFGFKKSLFYSFAINFISAIFSFLFLFF